MNDSAVHVFTSITSNYIPKARVLAASVKRLAPDAVFHLMLCDQPPPGFDLADEPFDSLLELEALDIPDLKRWVFGHTVVELCTAVKGFAFRTLLRRGAGKVFYFDPDMVVFGRLDELIARLDSHSVLLTPHQSEPEQSLEAIADNEIASLKHGVFNLGFLGVRNSAEGRRFVDWWADRLHHFCVDDIAGGLFTDQRWVDLAPCFFDDLRVMRDAGFNVATWNLTHRRVSGSLQAGIRVNDEALGFYHFSGFDSGAQETMLNKYGASDPTLFEMRAWYIAECERQGQSALGRLPARYSTFDDGTSITRAQRRLYRSRVDLQRAFPDPFDTSGQGGYRGWYSVNAGEADGARQIVLRSDVRYAQTLSEFLAFTEGRLRQSPRARPLKSMGLAAVRAMRAVSRRWAG
ncbi:MAG: glycosyl transferase [Burkholderiaceae bacterium]